jgi:hypothetical protein
MFDQSKEAEIIVENEVEWPNLPEKSGIFLVSTFGLFANCF